MGYPKLFIIAKTSLINLVYNVNFQNFVKIPSFRILVVKKYFVKVKFIFWDRYESSYILGNIAWFQRGKIWVNRRFLHKYSQELYTFNILNKKHIVKDAYCCPINPLVFFLVEYWLRYANLHFFLLRFSFLVVKNSRKMALAQ